MSIRVHVIIDRTRELVGQLCQFTEHLFVILADRAGVSQQVKENDYKSRNRNRAYGSVGYHLC
jgi:uncharacterized hydantoinase/oxoprolinase family protein